MAEKDVTKPISLDPRGGRPRDKCETHIEGIDRILNGGLPIGNIVLLAGTVGSGKTTLAMEFLINGAKAGETCCYISVTEPSSKMLSNLQTYGFFDESLVKEGKLRYREDVVDGLENAPRTFIGMLNGENFGKTLIKVTG